jgi:RNA polymerase sigma-70 factor (ECF subfamily)
MTEDSVVLVAALRRLPPDQRLALVLFHIVELSVAEIAAETGVAVGTVKARLSRGRQALSVLLSSTESESNHV